MSPEAIISEITRVDNFLQKEKNWQNMELTRDWARTFPIESGVYILLEGHTVVYTGESGSLQGRVMDMLNSRHHTVRRALGELRFKNEIGYKKATSSIKYPDHIEELVQTTMKKLKISVISINFGRKEIEEYIESKYRPFLNRKFKRGGRLPLQK